MTAIQNKVKPVVAAAPLRVEYTEHALLRMLQRKVTPTAIPALVKRLCQAKIGERVAVQVADEVVVGVRATSETAKIVTAWRLTDEDGPEAADLTGEERFVYEEVRRAS